jgi:ribonuclease T
MKHNNNKKHLMSKRIRGYYPVVIDIETTGLYSKSNGILEISAVLLTCDNKSDNKSDDNKNPDLKILEQHDYVITPHAAADIDPKALEVNKIDISAPGRVLVEQGEREALLDLFVKIKKQMKAHDCRRAILVAHNAAFDQGFLHEAIDRCELKNRSPFHPFSVIDTVSLGAMKYGQTVLSEICKKSGLGFDAKQAHSAKYDTLKTAELFCLLMN